MLTPQIAAMLFGLSERGIFRFEEVTVGETYILTVFSKRFQFSNGTQVLFVTDDISDLVFIADWQ